MRKNDIEKSLKRFLKRKVSYSLSLLIAFMITGGISLGAGITAEEIQETKSDLLTRIQTEREEIKRKIAENERLIKEYNSDFVELVRKGDFYSKPLFNSTQVFLSYQYLDSGKMKDRTDKEFKETIDAINKHYGTKTGRSLFRSSGNIGKDKIMAGNGVAVDTEVFREEIEVGANIVPIEPILPEINKTINVTVGVPTIGGIPSLTSPTVTAPTAPGAIIPPTISVTTPGAVASINVTAPSVPTPTVPGDKTIVKPTVTIPNAVDPTMVNAPEKPTAPEILIPEIPDVEFSSLSIGNGNKRYADHSTGENGFISNIAVLNGKFYVDRDNREKTGVSSKIITYGGFDYRYSDYVAYGYIGAATAGETLGNNAITTLNAPTNKQFYNSGSSSSYYTNYGTGVQAVTTTYIGIYNNGDFVYSGRNERSNLNLREFVHMDNHGATNSYANIRAALVKATDRSNATIAQYISAAKAANVINAWDDASALSSTLGGSYNASKGGTGFLSQGMMWTNSGKIILEGGNLSLTNQYKHSSAISTTFAINTDEIIIRPYNDGIKIYDAYNSGFLVSNDSNSTNQQVLYNSGSMKIYTNDSAAYTINSGGGSILNTVVVNRGTIEMTGKGSLGIYAKSANSTSGTLYMDFTDGAGTRKPVVLYGDESIGLYVTNSFNPSGNNIYGNFHADIGDSLGTANKVLNVAAGDTNGGQAINNYYGDNTNTDKIEGTVGILSYKSMTLDSHGIKIYSNTENSIGVVPITTTTGTSPTLTLGTGSVEVLGGESNIGMIAMNIYGTDGITLKNKGGSIVSSSTVVLDGGKNNVGAVAKNGYSISIKDIKGNGNTSVNGIGLYADGASITTTGGISNLKLSVDSPTSSDNINALGAFAANGATITVNKAALSSTPDIEIQGAEVSGSAGSYRGIGLMVDGGTINAQYTNIKVTDGAAGVASIGASGNIDISNGKIEVNNGYAAYTDGIGKINLTNTEIILGGTATAFDIDKDTMAPVTLTLTGTKVHVKSNDVIVFNIKNLPATSISALEAAVTSGVTVTSDLGITEYLEAALEKTTINVDTAMNKASMSGADFYYFNRVVAQNSVLNVNNPVTANLASVSTASALGADAYKGQVIGLEMNSSKNATSNATTKINNTSIISAARTDAGAGAVGVFINYGQLDNSGTIEVQKGYTGVKGGTGVFATNGSKVDNKLGATIDAYGEEALGIYATAWRKTSLGTLAGEEFGATALNQGETSVINSGDIVTNGDKSVGIYLENNSRDASLAIGMNRNISAENAGTITVGKDSIGIYASGTGTGFESETEVKNTGTIKVGENSTGIYGENAVTVTNIGNFELGKGATGIALSPDSKIDPAATFGTITTTGGVSDRVILAIHGDTSSPAATSIVMPGGTLDTSSISNMTSLYVQGANGASTNAATILKIGASGVGVYVNAGTATNAGKIELASGKTNAVGMYTKKGTISNTGTIEVGDSTQLGMVGVSTDAILTNTGTIDLKGVGAAGIVVQNGATITDSGASNLAFSSTKSFGIAADNANVVLNGGNVSINNTGENIYVYAKNNSNTTISGVLTIDGIAADPTKKSVGIYLDGTNTLTNNSTLTAVNGSIGVYANGANSLTNGIYNSTGDSTVGIYFTNGGTLANTTVNSGSSSGNSVGVYAAGGQVNISGGLTLNIGTSGNTGTGMYFANGASAAGDTITVTNSSAASSNIGLYYTGTGSTTHGANLILAGANREVGIFADGGLNLTNTSNITDNTATGSVGVLVGGGSTYRGTGVFTANTAGTAIGYFVNNGTAENGNSIDITGAGAASVGMVASASSGTATVTNTGNINTSSNVGMAVLTGTGTSAGINSGTINTATGTGVYVKGANAGFNGAGGTINITGAGTGIVLDAAGAGKVTNAGTINLVANSVGVYAENASAVDFPLTVKGTSGTGVYAKSGSTVSGNINAADSVDTVAVYLEDATAGINGATVTAGSASVTTSIGVFLGGTAQTYALSNNTINVNSSGTIGVLADNGNTINYSSTTNVGTGAIGMYLKGAGTTLNANAGTINITGTGIGVLVDTGATANLGTTGTLTVNFNGGGGILSFNNGGTVNLGANITIGSGTGTLAATKDGNLSNSGTITIGNGSAGLLGVYSAGGPYTVSNTATGVINVQAGGLGLVATGTGAAVTVKNDNIINVTGQDAVGMYADVGNIDNALGTINVTNNGIGMYLAGTGSILNFGTLNVTKGVGYVVNGATLGGATGTVTLHAGDADNYSIGGYYLNTSGIINLPTITDADYSIKAAINGGTNTVTGAITASGGQNKIGIFASNSTTTLGTVTAGGKGNIGVYGTNSNLDISGIAVTNSTLTAAEDMSVGVVLNGGSYNGSGNVSVGDNGIGLYATGIQGGNNIIHNGGTLHVGNSSLGFYGEGVGTGTKNLTVNTTGITIGTNNAVGVYVKNMDTSVSGNMGIGKGSSVGIASIGNGNIGYTGSITINDKADQAASVGIYKLAGTGTITTSPGNWTVGAGGYGIYVQQAVVTKDVSGNKISTMTSNSAVINNSADMTLGMSSVGIFSNGANTVNNSGDITVGKTFVPGGNHSDVANHLNSVGIYGAGETKIYNAAGATIKVHEDHSVGVYVDGTNTRFENHGMIDIDKGGVGVIVRNGAIAINEIGGVITLGANAAECGAVNVGMSASGPGSTIENRGTITINSGVGMTIENQAILRNTGTMNVNNGVGITGSGTIVNSGTMNVAPGAVGEGAGGLATANVGAVTITPDGTITINGNYVSIGGTLSTAGAIIVDGAYVDVTTGTPLFNAHSVSGEVRILSNFATTGNGRTYEMEGFVNTAMGTITGTKLTPVTSPLFIAKVTDKGSLVIAKRDYNDLVIGEQFKELYKGLDNILEDSNGKGRDADILKGLNEYLDKLPADQFERETSQKLAETRGDIYATIQGRMQDINQAFDNSFYELESSYNLTKDSSKYSVIYTDGKYRDSTLGIDDYDYKVMGLLYMKEKEGTEYGSKYGYTIGFAGSKFDFDDGGSKEDVYSLRVGAHRVKNLSEEHKVSWLSRIELGYNRHIAKRKLNLQENYENKGEYNTYSVAFDNRLTKVIYTDLSRQLDVYADLDLEYGKVDDFKESAGSKGGLEVQIKDNDYLSAQAGAGVKASQRIYAGNDISVKVTADVKYAYEFGDNYDGNKARLKNGGEGYYSLITPEEREGKLTGKVGLTIEKANHMGVTFEVEAADENHKKDSSIKYGVRFNYKF